MLSCLTQRSLAHLGAVRVLVALGVLLPTLVTVACGRAEPSAAASAAPESVVVQSVSVREQPIVRYLRVTGSLTAEDQAEVSAETAGRVVATPIELGTRVSGGALLVRISPTETEAQLREAEANAAQLEAKLGMTGTSSFDGMAVPEVLSAKASLEWAESEFKRVSSLRDQQLVAQSDFDQKRSQRDAAIQQYQVAQNAAQQSYRSLEAARARVMLARKALDDTSVRAPFAGVVSERRVSVGDYVTKGAPVATVVRIDPLRVQLTVPETSVARVEPDQPVSLAVDSYAGQTFTGRVRYVSPSLKPEQRALTIEAVVPNADGRLKPGMFVTAEITQPRPEAGLLVPAAAVRNERGTTRVFVVRDDHVEERIVTTGQVVGELVEIVNGLQKDESVAVTNLNRLTDGSPVKMATGPAAPVAPMSGS